MPNLESPTCALPGEEIRVIVRVEDNPTVKQLMQAMGKRHNDGKSFSVVVTREDDTQQTWPCQPS